MYVSIYISICMFIYERIQKHAHKKMLLALLTLPSLHFSSHEKMSWYFMFYHISQQKWLSMQKYGCDFLALLPKLMLHFLDMTHPYIYLSVSGKVSHSSHFHWHQSVFQKKRLQHIKKCREDRPTGCSVTQNIKDQLFSFYTLLRSYSQPNHIYNSSQLFAFIYYVYIILACIQRMCAEF